MKNIIFKSLTAECGHYDKLYNKSTWWHTGESEFENNSTSERERHLIWERFKIPGWLPFQELN